MTCVGVELGGTWLRLSVRRAGFPLIDRKWPAVSLPELPSFIKKVLLNLRLKPDRLAVASKGIWTPSERQALQRRLQPLAKKVHVMSDVEGAFLATFGERPHEPCVLLIAGTGSICYGQDRQGRRVRVGGLGPLLGDEGSAFWMGRQWLKKMNRGFERAPLQRLRRNGMTQARIAAYAPRVIKAARRGVRPAETIVQEACQHLFALVRDCVYRLKAQEFIRLSLQGGLMDNGYFQKKLKATIGRGLSQTIVWVSPTRKVSQALCQ